MTISPSNQIIKWGTLQISIFVIGVCLVVYIIIFLVWNYSNSDPKNRPSGLLWDFRKEGYKKNPLDDRYGNK